MGSCRDRGVLRDPVVDLQPVHQATDHVLLQRELADLVQLRLVVGRRAQDGESLEEFVGPKSSEPAVRPRRT